MCSSTYVEDTDCSLLPEVGDNNPTLRRKAIEMKAGVEIGVVVEETSANLSGRGNQEDWSEEDGEINISGSYGD